MDSSISVQCSFFEDHLPRDFSRQFEFSGSDSNMIEDKQIFICIWYLSTKKGLSRCISVESYTENENVGQNGSVKEALTKINNQLIIDSYVNIKILCWWGDSNSWPLGCKSSALAIVLKSSKASAGKELSLSRWCFASLYIYHFLLGRRQVNLCFHFAGRKWRKFAGYCKVMWS